VFDNDLCAIVHPSATGTALTALGASLALKGPEGERTVPIEEFFVRPETDVTRETVLRPGELIVEVRVPAGRKSGYVKLMEKQSFDWPLAEAAVTLGDDPRVVLGAAAPVPTFLGGQRPTEEGRPWPSRSPSTDGGEPFPQHRTRHCSTSCGTISS